jgi:hypothetical protein
MATVKYRLGRPKLRPRRTRLEIPGWAGKPEPRVDGSHEYAWHCIPFSEAAKAGMEVFYPFDDELRVSVRDGELTFEGDFRDGDEGEAKPPPFRSFGKEYYTFQILMDLKVDEGMAVKVETHPRFYTDTTGTVPIAVPAIVRHWWPMIYFVVFKTPATGQTHVFRPDEPFMQITVVEADEKIDLVEMPAEEAAEREMQSRRIYASRATLSGETQWTSDTNTVFDGTYRRILGAANASKEK